MSHPYYGNPWLAPAPAPNGGPPNGGLPPGMSYAPIPQPSMQMFRPSSSQSSYQAPTSQPSSSRNEPPGARLHGQPFEIQGVRVLFPLNTAIFHIMDEKFTAGVPGAEIQPYIYFTGLSVNEFFDSLGIKRGVTEWLELGGNESVKAQTIMVGDVRTGKKLEEVGWIAGRGVTSKPIWLQIL
ncbi:MAG: hypothetical protein LQ337_003139 [Flavoplaca oasis]|nr:MAG: hypothetical protein LQ337_003139 [Flavoplaca oasis]